ncbi:hypothetical protein OESDEN_10069 [Oesophagostomum dentatum]|uniref:SSD domain-containing protein n=1 Tax=Oesophagostomum dentatum TaxID=61180 RepID=A0A0B1T1S3_OESDE|nr:hypothetical protein OESDEN_10069 [Oesophagostomum dentatum]
MLAAITTKLSTVHHFQKEMRSNETDPDRQLGYPESMFHGTPLFIGMHFHDVKAIPGTNKLEAKSVVLWYFSRVDTPQRKQTYKETTLNLFDISNDGSFSDLINFYIFGDEIANSEMVRGALEATFLMSIGFVLLLIFVIGVIWRQSSLRVTPYLVAVTLITPFMATISAFGLLSWLRYPIYSMQCVTPFLVLGIGEFPQVLKPLLNDLFENPNFRRRRRIYLDTSLEAPIRNSRPLSSSY